jgi:hypothetical protein
MAKRSRTARRPVPGAEALEGRALTSYLIVPRGQGFVPVHVSDARRDEPLFGNGLAAKHAPHFYPLYAGPQLPELNGLRAAAYVSGKDLVLSGTVAGPIAAAASGAAQDASFCFGVDRGGASKQGPFPGRPRVRFDAVVVASVVNGKVSATLQLNDPRTNLPGTPKALAASSVAIAGDTVTVTVPLSMIPSSGHAMDQWNVNFFTRDPDLKSNVRNVASFTPEYTDFQVYVKPPSTQ